MKSFVILLALTTPALAAEPTFTKEEANAIYTLGTLNAAAEQAKAELKAFAATPSAKAALDKMKPEPTKKP